MEFVQGINFHSNKGYRYPISNGYQQSSFEIDTHIFGLLNVQKYTYLVQVGQKFFFVYPIRTPNGNKQVFGSGEIVRSLQEGRETILVPFVQYFACSLSDAVKYNMNFATFFKQYGSNYQDVFSKSQANGNLTPQPLTIEPNPDRGNIIPQYSELQESFGSRGTKTKRYVATLEEGLDMLNNLMLSPDVIRWSFSAILTPLDVDYPENIVIVYGQTQKPQVNPAHSSLVLQLHSGDQKAILEQFFEYVKYENKINSKTPDVAVLDSIKLDELEELLRKFLKEYSRKEEKNINIEKSVCI